MKISRRDFARLSTCVIGLAAASPNVLAIDAFNRPGEARLRLSLAAYSFRDSFKDSNHKRDHAAAADKQIDMFQFIDYCAEHGCQGAEVTSYYFPAKITEDYMLQLKRHAFLRGVSLSGTAVGNSFTAPAGEKREKQIAGVKQWIDRCELMGIPHIRVFAGSPDGQPLDTAKANCIEALTECCAYAAKKGVFLGIENHGGIVAQPEVLLDIIKTVKSPWLGINLDTANFHTENPYEDIARCAPYAVNVQVKTEVHPKGQKTAPADFKRLVKILTDANYQGWVALEYEAAEDAHTAVPRALRELQALM
jgi:sugar phosphate isomerase/epimerase